MILKCFSFSVPVLRVPVAIFFVAVLSGCSVFSFLDSPTKPTPAELQSVTAPEFATRRGARVSGQ